MSADHLRHVIARSAIVRTAARAIAAFRAAAESSTLASSAVRARRELSALRPEQRVRLAGLLVATALATEQLLLMLIPAQLRPSPPPALRVEVALAALAVILAAPQLARAWPTSRLRRILASLRE